MKNSHTSLFLFVIILLTSCFGKISSPNYEEEIKFLAECFKNETLTDMQEEEINKIVDDCDTLNFVQSISVRNKEEIWFKINKYSTILSTENITQYIVYDFDGTYKKADQLGDNSYYYTKPNWYNERWFSICLVEESM